MINLDGERFVDEGEDFNLYTYAKMGRDILQQRSATVFQVFDQKTVPLLETRYNTGTPVVADTLSDLADRIEERYASLGFRPGNFLTTLEAYNGTVQEGTFDPDILDGKHTLGLRPEKTNCHPIDEPHVLSYAVSLASHSHWWDSINTDAAVVDFLSDRFRASHSEMTGGFSTRTIQVGLD